MPKVMPCIVREEGNSAGQEVTFQELAVISEGSVLWIWWEGNSGQSREERAYVRFFEELDSHQYWDILIIMKQMCLRADVKKSFTLFRKLYFNTEAETFFFHPGNRNQGQGQRISFVYPLGR